MSQEQEELWVDIISLIIQDGGTHSGQRFYMAVLKYNGKSCRLDLLCFWASEDI